MASLLQLFSGRTPDTLLCREVKEALQPFEIEDVRDAVHVVTHCLKPDCAPISVWVEMFEGGYLVSDGGVAFRAFKIRNPDGARKVIEPIATEFGLRFEPHPVHGFQLQSAPPDLDHLRTSIIGVSNAVAHAMRALLSLSR